MFLSLLLCASLTAGQVLVEDCYDQANDCFHFWKPPCRGVVGEVSWKRETRDGRRCPRHCSNPDGRRGGAWCTIYNDLWAYCFKECPRETCDVANTELVLLPNAKVSCIPLLNTDPNDEVMKSCFDFKRGCFYVTNPKCPKIIDAYQGGRNYTTEGTPCVKQQSRYESKYKNYCRNWNTGYRGPWCYTKEDKTAWEWCFPMCEEDCFNLDKGCFHADRDHCKGNDDYRGIRNLAVNGKQCMSWGGEHREHKNYCRNWSKKQTGPYCKTDSNSEEPCFPPCKDRKKECYDFEKGCFYASDRNCHGEWSSHVYESRRTVNHIGKTCSIWQGDNDQNEQNNLCKNLDFTTEGAWCFNNSIRKPCYPDCKLDHFETNESKFCPIGLEGFMNTTLRTGFHAGHDDVPDCTLGDKCPPPYQCHENGACCMKRPLPEPDSVEIVYSYECRLNNDVLKAEKVCVPCWENIGYRCHEKIERRDQFTTEAMCFAWCLDDHEPKCPPGFNKLLRKFRCIKDLDCGLSYKDKCSPTGACCEMILPPVPKPLVRCPKGWISTPSHCYKELLSDNESERKSQADAAEVCKSHNQCSQLPKLYTASELEDFEKKFCKESASHKASLVWLGFKCDQRSENSLCTTIQPDIAQRKGECVVQSTDENKYCMIKDASCESSVGVVCQIRIDAPCYHQKLCPPDREKAGDCHLFNGDRDCDGGFYCEFNGVCCRKLPLQPNVWQCLWTPNLVKLKRNELNITVYKHEYVCEECNPNQNEHHVEQDVPKCHTSQYWKRLSQNQKNYVHENEATCIRRCDGSLGPYYTSESPSESQSRSRTRHTSHRHSCLRRVSNKRTMSKLERVQKLQLKTGQRKKKSKEGKKFANKNGGQQSSKGRRACSKRGSKSNFDSKQPKIKNKTKTSSRRRTKLFGRSCSNHGSLKKSQYLNRKPNLKRRKATARCFTPVSKIDHGSNRRRMLEKLKTFSKKLPKQNRKISWKKRILNRPPGQISLGREFNGAQWNRKFKTYRKNAQKYQLKVWSNTKKGFKAKNKGGNKTENKIKKENMKQKRKKKKENKKKQEKRRNKKQKKIRKGQLNKTVWKQLLGSKNRPKSNRKETKKSQKQNKNKNENKQKQRKPKRRQKIRKVPQTKTVSNNVPSSKNRPKSNGYETRKKQRQRQNENKNKQKHSKNKIQQKIRKGQHTKTLWKKSPNSKNRRKSNGKETRKNKRKKKNKNKKQHKQKKNKRQKKKHNGQQTKHLFKKAPRLKHRPNSKCKDGRNGSKRRQNCLYKLQG